MGSNVKTIADRWTPGTLITVRGYRRETRDLEGEVYAAGLGKEGPFVSVRLFVPDGEPPQFRRFFVAALEAD